MAILDSLKSLYNISSTFSPFKLPPLGSKTQQPQPTGMGPVPEAAANAQARALKSPTATASLDVTKPIVPKPTPKPAPPAPPANAALDQLKQEQANLAATGSALPQPAPAPSPAPTPSPTPTPAPAASAAPSQLSALQQGYLSTFQPTAAETQAQTQLDTLAQQQAQAVAQANQEYADRIKAVQEQATLQPFLTGREQQAQGQLANQMAALQAGSQAQTLPLTERLAQLQAQRQAQQQQQQAAIGFATPEKPVEVGNALVDPKTGKVIYQGQSSAQPTASIQEYEYAKANGYTGSYTQYQNEDANRKAIVAAGSNPDRVLSATEAQALGVPFGTTASQAYGISPTKPMTEAQSKDAGFAARAGESNTYIDNLESKIAGMSSLSFAAQVAAEPNAVGNAFVSDDIRQLRQAERNFETAVLRRESGAAISASEFATDEKKYFPRPGDDAKTLEQKKQARQAAIKAMLPQAGAGSPDTSAPAAGDYSW